MKNRLGAAGPGLSYLDDNSGDLKDDFTQRNTTFMTWDSLYLAKMLKEKNGITAHGNQRSAWDVGCTFDYPIQNIDNYC